MSTLNEFISGVKAGMARTNHFMVQLTLPEQLSIEDPIRSNMRKIILFCDQAQIPGLSYGTNQVRSYGEFREVPYEKLYEAVNLSFYVDVDMNVKALFDKWMALVQDPVTRSFNYPKEYCSSTVSILVSGSDERDRYQVNLKNVYPKAVAPIQLDYSSREIMKLQVTFTYEYAEFKQLLVSSNAYLDDNINVTQKIAEFDYGYEAPEQYFNSFLAFQNDYNQYQNQFNQYQNLSYNVDKNFGISAEDVGIKTGYGGIFI